jgi:hypothetical protein
MGYLKIMTYNPPKSWYYLFAMLEPKDLEKDFENTLSLGIKHIPIAHAIMDKFKKETRIIDDREEDDEIEEGEIIDNK